MWGRLWGPHLHCWLRASPRVGSLAQPGEAQTHPWGYTQVAFLEGWIRVQRERTGPQGPHVRRVFHKARLASPTPASSASSGGCVKVHRAGPHPSLPDSVGLGGAGRPKLAEQESVGLWEVGQLRRH